MSKIRVGLICFILLGLSACTGENTPTVILGTPDIFQLTATAIITTATAYAIASPVPCESAEWFGIEFYYSETSENWLQTPTIRDDIGLFCLEELPREFSHEIIINANSVLDNERLYIILDDAVSRLPEYPPHNELAQMVFVWNIEIIPIEFGSFEYSEAIAAYNLGLRGADLAAVLGVRRR